MTLRLLTEHHLEFLSLKGDCTSSSVSTHMISDNQKRQSYRRPTGLKWQLKTLFLAIFDPHSSFIKSVFNCRLPGVDRQTSQKQNPSNFKKVGQKKKLAIRNLGCLPYSYETEKSTDIERRKQNSARENMKEKCIKINMTAKPSATSARVSSRSPACLQHHRLSSKPEIAHH